MADPVGLAFGGAKGIFKVAGGIIALKQAPEEVESARREIQAHEKKVDELVDLLNKHFSLLEQDPHHLDTVNSAIDEAYKALGACKPVVERNTTREYRVERFSPSHIKRPIQWCSSDRRLYQILREDILRTNVEVKDQIKKLEDVARDWRSNLRQDLLNEPKTEQEAQGEMEDEQTVKQAEMSKGLARLFRVVVD